MQKKRKLVAVTILVCTLLFVITLSATGARATSMNNSYDVNRDGSINIVDIVTISLGMGKAQGSGGYNSDYDYNKDGIVDINDLKGVVAASIGKADEAESVTASEYASPSAIVEDKNSDYVYVVEHTGNKIDKIDSSTDKKVKTYAVGNKPNGVVISSDSSKMFVTYDGAESGVDIYDIDTGDKLNTSRITTGHTPMAPILSSDDSKLYVANRYSGTISVINIENQTVANAVYVGREPISMALNNQTGKLYVAHHASEQAAVSSYIAPKISVINTNTNTVERTILLPDGSTGVRQIAMSPDGNYLYASHLMGRYWITTSQLDKDWMNNNMMSIIDIGANKYVTSVILDDMTRGSANPWGITCSEDGKSIIITSSGTHEITVIDRLKLHKKIADVQTGVLPRKDANGKIMTTDLSLQNGVEDIPDDISFISQFKTRIALKGNGPRAIVMKDSKAFVANYFSNSVDVVTFGGLRPQVSEIKLSTASDANDPIRLGEKAFCDAVVCFQNVQSCSSCHPDTRADSLNWDNLNDGIGNPKNVKSLLYAHYTAPSMITGIRADATVGVRAGLKYIEFYGGADLETIASNIDAYLRNLQEDESPYLVHGQLTATAEAGKVLFNANCAGCHNTDSGRYFQDGAMHTVNINPDDTMDIVTQRAIVGDSKYGKLNTPSLNEVWRTAPYLYDGRATTVQDAIKALFPSRFTEEQINQLAEYVLSL